MVATDFDMSNRKNDSNTVADCDIPVHTFPTNLPLLTAVLMAAGTTGGTTYAFGLFGAALKANLHLQQSELDTISAATFCAGLLSWAPGMFVDRFGARLAITIGGLSGACSLLLYWAVATERFPVSREWAVAALSALGVWVYVSSAAVTGSVFKVIVGTCGGGTKGSAVGAAKGYVGLGTGAYATIFAALRGPDGPDRKSNLNKDLNFLPMCAFFAVAVASLPAACLLPRGGGLGALSGRVDGATPCHFRVLFTGLFGLGAVVVGRSLLELRQEDSGSGGDGPDRNIWVAALVVLLWFGPIMTLPCIPPAVATANDQREDCEEGVSLLLRNGEDDGVSDSAMAVERPTTEADQTSENPPDDGSTPQSTAAVAANVSIHQRMEEEDTGLLASDDDGDDEGGAPAAPAATKHSTPPCVLPQLNLRQMLSQTSAWAMFFTFSVLGGSGTIMTNNVGQMVEALGLPPSTASAALALFSVAQAGSRVATGAVSEAAASWDVRCWGGGTGVPRPAFLVAASLAAAASHALLAMATGRVIFIVGVVLSGAAFGMIWPLMVLITEECFGKKHHGANYMFYDGSASAVGTLLLSKFLAQWVYEGHIQEGGDSENDTTCVGEECFRLSHIIVSLLALSCVVPSVAVMYNTRHIYQRDDAKREPVGIQTSNGTCA
eukprot:CAMPEP_0194341878 /NCGR_PEP_ID=MMETSP0171-20130528/91091_1 /TAXON_ID=218684 /ORGANISM="Corethron pennatum, Strain L29A3" /LENGTH=663 /DNA_ID=CAMNT_0039107379 /DNA_START=162 /DNA_END=2153 /DNA_ORIENTATION=+